MGNPGQVSCPFRNSVAELRVAGIETVHRGSRGKDLGLSPHPINSAFSMQSWSKPTKIFQSQEGDNKSSHVSDDEHLLSPYNVPGTVLSAFQALGEADAAAPIFQRETEAQREKMAYEVAHGYHTVQSGR